MKKTLAILALLTLAGCLKQNDNGKRDFNALTDEWALHPVAADIETARANGDASMHRYKDGQVITYTLPSGAYCVVIGSAMACDWSRVK